MPKCCVMGCINQSSTDGSRVKFFRFPNDRRCKERSELTNARQIAWLYAIRRLDLKDSSLKQTAICSEHFISGFSNKHSPEWTQETTEKLIDLWRQHPCLYDLTHSLYGNTDARNDALTKITDDMETLAEGITQEDIKIKLGNLRINYYRKLKEQIDKRKDTADTDDEKWFTRLSFLNDFLTTKQISTFEVEIYDKTTENGDNLEDTLLTSLKNESPQKVISPIKRELSQESEVPTVVSDPLSLTSSTMVQNSSPRYPDDIEAFGEHVKAEVNKVFDDELRDEAMHKINNIMFEIKAKQRSLNSHSFT